MRRPVKSPYRITLRFGAMSTPYSAKNPHNGVDYAHLIPGTRQPLYAPESGIATRKRDDRSGNKIWIYVKGVHKYTLAHLSKYEITDTQKVKEGQLIGYTGRTGLATGVHLHLVYYKNGQPADFEKALKENRMYKNKTAKEWYGYYAKVKKSRESWRDSARKALALVKELRSELSIRPTDSELAKELERAVKAEEALKNALNALDEEKTKWTWSNVLQWIKDKIGG